jgi:hypothetical protein
VSRHLAAEVSTVATRATTGPRPVFCVIEHLHRRRDIADDAVAGRFTCAGVSLELGRDPDWVHDGLSRDEEWRIEWSKFYFGLDLAFAYRETGDSRYLRSWEHLACSWIEQVPPDLDPSDVTGRRLQNWVYAWQAFNASGRPGPSPETAALLLASIADQLDHLVRSLTPERNHRTLELYAVLVVTLALPELDAGGRLLSFAWTQLHRNLLEDVWPDGVHRECSTHYHLIALRSFLAARENARRFGLGVPDGYDDRLALACRFAIHVHRPDGLIPALSDSDTADHTDVLVLADRLIDLPGLRWLATSGRAGAPPSERSVSFPYGGYFMQRSGWGAGEDPYASERFLVFDAGPIGDGGHGHYDALSIEAYALGRPLVVDPGRYTYSEADENWRRWFKGTAAHNTVTVDGLDQTPYRRGKPRKGDAATARLLSRSTTGGFDLLVGQVRSAAYDVVHTRQVAFVADEYWIVVDTLEAAAGTPHEYTQRMHLSPEAWTRTSVQQRIGDVVVRAPGVALVYPDGVLPEIEDGWVSPEYGIRRRAPVVSRTAHAASRERMISVLWPTGHDEHDPPRLAVDRCDEAGVAVRLDGVGPRASQTDHLAWAGAGTPAGAVTMSAGPMSVSARIAWIRTGRGGRPARAALLDCDGCTWTGPAPRPDPIDPGDGWRVLPGLQGAR